MDAENRRDPGKSSCGDRRLPGFRQGHGFRDRDRPREGPVGGIQGDPSSVPHPEGVAKKPQGRGGAELTGPIANPPEPPEWLTFGTEHANLVRAFVQHVDRAVRCDFDLPESPEPVGEIRTPYPQLLVERPRPQAF